MDWLDKGTTLAMTPTVDEFVAKCRELQQQNGDGIKVTSGKKWWFKGKHPDNLARTPQVFES